MAPQSRMGEVVPWIFCSSVIMVFMRNWQTLMAAIDKTSLDRLVALGRKSGRLTTENLRDVLPIAAMSANDIALVVVHLEDAGIPVELEDSLLTEPKRPQPAATQGAEIVPLPDRSGSPRSSTSEAVPLQLGVPPMADEPVLRHHDRRRVHWAVAIAGIIVLALLGLVILVYGA